MALLHFEDPSSVPGMRACYFGKAEKLKEPHSVSENERASRNIATSCLTLPLDRSKHGRWDLRWPQRERELSWGGERDLSGRQQKVELIFLWNRRTCSRQNYSPSRGPKEDGRRRVLQASNVSGRWNSSARVFRPPLVHLQHPRRQSRGALWQRSTSREQIGTRVTGSDLPLMAMAHNQRHRRDAHPRGQALPS